ncbi:MAG: hypothetical protein NTX53_08595 [candidate division WOR-3 bacterium]|nr:hypothetical protein [candidate division WOR-3 bacterium]
MENDSKGWMDWLHEYRAAQERKRREMGTDEVEWMKRTTARAREILARLPKREQPLVVRDKPATQPSRPRSRKP